MFSESKWYLIVAASCICTCVVVYSVTTAFSPIIVPDLTVSTLSDQDIALAALDIFAKGLETQSEFLLKSSADSSLQAHVASQLNILRTNAGRMFNANGPVHFETDQEPYTTFTLFAEAWDSLALDSVTAGCLVRLFIDDTCVYASTNQAQVIRTDQGWRVHNLTDIDSLCSVFFATGAWQ